MGSTIIFLSVNHAISAFLGLIMIKLVALAFGPSGVGLISVLRQIQQTLCSVINLGGQNSIIQVIGNLKSSERVYFLAAALKSMATLLLITFLLLFVFRKDIHDHFYSSHLTFLDEKIFIVIFLLVLFGCLLNFFRAINSLIKFLMRKAMNQQNTSPSNKNHQKNWE